MSPYTFVDIEMYSDREDDSQALYAELTAEEDGAEDELPPSFRMSYPNGIPGERRHDCLSSHPTDNR